MQEFITFALFAFSVLYLIREFRKNFTSKDSSACHGCSACSTADLEKIAAELQNQNKSQPQQQKEQTV